MAEPTATPRGIVIAAPSSGSGKTTITLGLLAALRDRGLRVAAAKVGPDYIDPRFLEAASGGSCVNLDPWAMPPERLKARLASHAAGHDVVIIEGVMGLFDGAEGRGGATADLASMLDLPILLVVDASRQAQSIAALVHGFATFRADINVVATIATRVGSDRHADMVANALEPLATIHLGSVKSNSELSVRSRHLGLVQACEQEELAKLLTAASRCLGQQVDLDELIQLTQPVPPLERLAALPPLGQRISIARDAAFGFIYPHILSDWHRHGSELHFFSPLANGAPASNCDAVYLPGGYPELSAGAISAAENFKAGVQTAVANGAAIYGECGGYMVLGKALIDEHGAGHPMLGLLSHVTSFKERRRQLGYRKLRRIADAPLPLNLRGHEFHYSTIDSAGQDAPLFEVTDSKGRNLGAVGGARERVFGSYMHMIDVSPGT